MRFELRGLWVSLVYACCFGSNRPWFESRQAHHSQRGHDRPRYIQVLTLFDIAMVDTGKLLLSFFFGMSIAWLTSGDLFPEFSTFQIQEWMMALGSIFAVLYGLISGALKILGFKVTIGKPITPVKDQIESKPTEIKE